MNLNEALNEFYIKGIDDHCLVRKYWSDSGSNLKLIPSWDILSGLTNESFFADDWMVVADNIKE